MKSKPLPFEGMRAQGTTQDSTPKSNAAKRIKSFISDSKVAWPLVLY
jgi:hypothetical protein